MGGEFDPVKAQREILQGLQDVFRVIKARSREAEQRLAEAESDHNSLAKIERFVEDLVNQADAKLKKLEEDARQIGEL